MNRNNHNTKQTFFTSMSQISSNAIKRIDDYIFDINENLKILGSAVNEYKSNISQINTNIELHNNISSEMNYLVDTIRSQVSNISRIKNSLNKSNPPKLENNKGSFKIKDIINRIKLLTDDELRENFCKLIIDLRIKSNYIVHGSATSLVQIILIHVINACHAYNKNPGDIELIVYTDKSNNLIFEIHDGAFNSKIYHENHNESDIYMSYMILKSEFNGNIWFESQDNGSSFYISLPAS